MNILIIGAGSAGKQVLSEIDSKDKVVGFLDQNSKSHGLLIDGVLVLGDYLNLENYIRNLKVNKVIVATTQISSLEINNKIKAKVDMFDNVRLEILQNIEDLNCNEKFTEQLNDVTINLSIPNLSLEIVDSLKECIETGWVSTGGRFIPEFEGKVARYLSVDDAVGVQSGTAGLHTALRILGVEYGNEVIAPTLTFIAAVNPIKYQGAEPIFMDCDDTLCIDPTKLEKFCREECNLIDGKLINKRTEKHVKALVVVHVFGNLANMEKIMDIAKEFHLKVLEDATEALGSYYLSGRYEGKMAGTIGDFGVYSFNANKIITTGGGGMMVSTDPELLEKARFLSTQAKTDQLYYIHDEIGYNYRMLNLQAALGSSQIDELEEFITTKINNHERYMEGVKEIPGLEIVSFVENARTNRWFYSLLIDQEKYGMGRDELLKKLIALGIQTRPIWGLLHEQKPYIMNQAYKIEKANYYYDRILNLPCSSNLKEKEVEIVIQTLKGVKK